MSAPLVIRNGRVIDPVSGLDEILTIYIDHTRILSLGDQPKDFKAQHVIDAAGKLIIPGVIDLACRMREPGEEHKATIRSEGYAAAASGITTLAIPPDTDPVIDDAPEVQLLRRRAKQSGRCWIIPIGALTRGLNGEALAELAALKAEGCPAVSNGLRPIPDSRVLMNCLAYAATYDIPVMIQPSEPWLSRNGCVHDGAVAARLGLPGIPEAAETTEIARVLALADATGAHVHFCRLSTARGAEQIRHAKQLGARISADVAMHQLFLSEQDINGFDSNCHVTPPLRTTDDRNALRHAVADGTIDSICSDHQPHDFDAKDNPFMQTQPGISALESLLPLGMELVESGVLTLATLVRRLTCGPARTLGLNVGRIAAGARADITIINPDQPWRLTRGGLRSRGQNSPFLQRRFSARVTHTIFEGRVVFDLATEPPPHAAD